MLYFVKNWIAPVSQYLVATVTSISGYCWNFRVILGKYNYDMLKYLYIEIYK